MNVIGFSITDIQQGKQLLTSGYDASSADLCYVQGNPLFIPFAEYQLQHPSDDGIEPSWSLGKLISMLPRSEFNSYNLGIEIWEKKIEYRIFDSLRVSPPCYSSTPVGALINILVWSKFNKNKLRKYNYDVL